MPKRKKTIRVEEELHIKLKVIASKRRKAIEDLVDMVLQRYVRAEEKKG